MLRSFIIVQPAGRPGDIDRHYNADSRTWHAYRDAATRFPTPHAGRAVIMEHMPRLDDLLVVLPYDLVDAPEEIDNGVNAHVLRMWADHLDNPTGCRRPNGPDPRCLNLAVEALEAFAESFSEDGEYNSRSAEYGIVELREMAAAAIAKANEAVQS